MPQSQSSTAVWNDTVLYTGQALVCMIIKHLQRPVCLWFSSRMKSSHILRLCSRKLISVHRTSDRECRLCFCCVTALGHARTAQQLMPRPVQWSGTIRKYLSMASQKRALYSSGETTVGIFPGDTTHQHSTILDTGNNIHSSDSIQAE